VTTTDPLASLIVDEDSIAREELAAGLKPYVQLSKKGGLWLQTPFDELDSATKVLCLLLAIKAQAMLDLRESDQASPAELIEISGMPGGTVRPKLSKLVEKRFLAKADREYRVPPAAVRKALAELETNHG